MAGIHEILGGLVVVAFIVMAILAAIAAAGRDIPWIRQASFIAAGLLVLQYVAGVLLLANGFRNSKTRHVAIALLVVVPVALQHSSARRLSLQSRAVALLIWALAAAVLSVLAYMTGMAGAGVPA